MYCIHIPYNIVYSQLASLKELNICSPGTNKGSRHTDRQTDKKTHRLTSFPTTCTCIHICYMPVHIYPDTLT